ncbi:MAG TPA: DsbA family protein [Sphingomicrobium sp.]|nr:DsbA family protein [Sphingomicrobium sp.]
MSQESHSQDRKALLVAAVGGGVISAALTAGFLFLAAPQLLGPRIVREGILKDPHVLVDGSEALKERQYEPVLDANRASLEMPFGSSWKGAAKPDVTIAYFYDYACGYCRRSNPDLERLIAEDKDLRVVYREFPILGPDSIAAARASLAASKAGKFAVFHDALYDAGNPTPETLAIAGNASGITPQQASDPAIEAEIENNYRMASALGASGTPLFVIGNQVINSAVGYQGLKEAVAKARAAKG